MIGPCASPAPFSHRAETRRWKQRQKVPPSPGSLPAIRCRKWALPFRRVRGRVLRGGEGADQLAQGALGLPFLPHQDHPRPDALHLQAAEVRVVRLEDEAGGEDDAPVGPQQGLHHGAEARQQGLDLRLEAQEPTFGNWGCQALRLLGSPVRMRMLEALSRQPQTARELKTALGLPHLSAVMRDLSSVQTSRRLDLRCVRGRHQYRGNEKTLHILAKKLRSLCEKGQAGPQQPQPRRIYPPGHFDGTTEHPPPAGPEGGVCAKPTLPGVISTVRKREVRVFVGA